MGIRRYLLTVIPVSIMGGARNISLFSPGL